MNRITSVSSDDEIDEINESLRIEDDETLLHNGAIGSEVGDDPFCEDDFLISGTGPLPKRDNILIRSLLPLAAGILSVHGRDDRKKIENTLRYPWRMICHLAIEGQNGIPSSGTGWLAGANAVITAGHCVYHEQTGGWASRIRVTPGRNGDAGLSSQISSRFECPSSWINESDPNFDFAIIYLDKPFPEDPGHFAYAAFPDAKLRDQLVNVCGYPGDKDDGTTLWAHHDKILMLEESQIHYHVDTEEGQSGAPVIALPYGPDGPPVVIGIHAYGFAGNTEFNSAPRINAAVYDALSRWITKSKKNF